MAELRLCWSKLTQQLVDRKVNVSFHPDFIGYFTRPDGYQTESFCRPHGWHSLLLLDSGCAQIGALQQDGSDGVVGPGTAVLLAPDCGGHARFEAGCRFHEVWFAARQCGQQLVAETGAVVVPQASHLAWLFERLAVDMAELKSGELRLLRYGTAMLLSQLLHAAASAHENGLTVKQRQDLVLWTRKHIKSVPLPADLAAVVQLSPDYFTRRFRQSFSESPRTWLIKERLRALARELHESSDSIAHLAETYGFTDAAHFGRIFKKYMKRSPSAWRREHAL